MTSYLYPGHYDLVTPDGRIEKIEHLSETSALAEVTIEEISPAFVGFDLPKEQIVFNFKSVLAQVGLNGVGEEIAFDRRGSKAFVRVAISTIGPLAREMLLHLHKGAYIGKLFAADERRRVRNPDYLARMFGRSDREGRPLLSLGGMQGSERLTIDKVEGRIVAFLALREGRMEYEQSVRNFFPTLGKALCHRTPLRDLLRLHQRWRPNVPRTVSPDEILLACSLPLHIRTVFGRVVDSLLPKGFQHTSANVLQPDTEASGDIYELFGNTPKEIYDIPLEFFTLEPHREHVFFADRDQLQECLEDSKSIFDAFNTAPGPHEHRAAVFIVKGSQMLRLKSEDWIIRNPPLQSFPGVAHKTRQTLMVERYIEQQPCYPFLKAIESGLITSQGVLFTRYFPSPLMKRMLLSFYVQSLLMRLYFQVPSRSEGYYFSQEDRAMLHDLVTFGIPIYWADETSGQILEYVQRPEKVSGMFVPLKKVETFKRATFFGIYGSNLLEGNFDKELKELLQGVLELRSHVNHPLLNAKTPLALVTGGGPGAMEMGNRMARELDILSCANIVNFQLKPDMVVNEQRQNPYVEAKMTYRLDQLVERQAEFYLDFPIFVMGGIGTDFEFALEELRHKVGSRKFAPILLFGTPEYWRSKISHRYQCNMANGTIKGSEWVSNSFFCIQTAKQGLQVYRDYFTQKLNIGPQGPIFEEGFVIKET
ncbi:MAG: LOG family protein [Chlamydiales bacterium]|nr:LOG family protein [Chlamydiales bacterium]